MVTKRFELELATEIPVLFAYIGWTRNYDGTEPPRGRMAYLRAHPEDLDVSETSAFLREKQTFRCGIGRGAAPRRVHVVFVALDPDSKEVKVVGVYAGATTEADDDWAYAHTRAAVLVPPNRRPLLPGGWVGQGVRRWARHPTANTHPRLFSFFNRLRRDLPKLVRDGSDGRSASRETDQTYWDISAVEGKLRRSLVAHRYREASLRDAKIRQALKDSRGRLICEVPGCAFDFYRRYGEIGSGYAQVHHLTPLSRFGKKGTKTTLDALAVVCANCHAMIHRGGQCREMAALIPKRARIRA